MSENKVQTTQEKSISDAVLNKIKELEKVGEINFPENYSYINALKSAQLMLSEQTVKKGNDDVPILQVCTRPSVINTLFDMTIQGLSPLKKQCYFIPRGNKLTLSRSYMGSIAVTKRLKGVKDVFANIIYKGDEFEYNLDLETGAKIITKHNQSFENIDTANILGAYAIVVLEEDPNYIEIMNINQVKKSWEMGQGKGNTKAHTNFGDEMVKKTVINRACKKFLNTSDDSDILIDAITRTKEYNPEDIIETSKKEADEEIMIEANKEELDIEVNKIEVATQEEKVEVIEAEIIEDKKDTDDEVDF